MYQTCTVTGRWAFQDGTGTLKPATGEVVIIADAPRIVATGEDGAVSVQARRLPLRLDKSGSILATLLAPGEGVQPSHFTYTVLVHLTDCQGRTHRRSFHLEPRAGETIDLVAAEPVISDSGTWVTKGDPGEPGARGEKGEKGDPGEPGAATLQDTGWVTQSGVQNAAGSSTVKWRRIGNIVYCAVGFGTWGAFNLNVTAPGQKFWIVPPNAVPSWARSDYAVHGTLFVESTNESVGAVVITPSVGDNPSVSFRFNRNMPAGSHTIRVGALSYPVTSPFPSLPAGA